MQSIPIALGALISRKQDLFQCPPKHTIEYSRFTQFDRQWILGGRTPDREGPPTEYAMLILQIDQAVQVGW